MQEVGKWEFKDDLHPFFVMGLLYHILRSFSEPLISFAAFNTLFGDQQAVSEASNPTVSVDVNAVKAALGSLKEENRVLLGYLLFMFRMLIDSSPLNLNSRSQTVMYGREVKRGGRAQIKRRIGEGLSVGDVIGSFGCVLMKPTMETERSVLRLIECNAVLEYLMLNAATLFGDVNLDQLSRKVEDLYKQGGLSLVCELKSPGNSPRKMIEKMPEIQEEEEENDESLEEVEVVTSVPKAATKGDSQDISLDALRTKALDLSYGSIEEIHAKPLPEAPQSDDDVDDDVEDVGEN